MHTATSLPIALIHPLAHHRLLAGMTFNVILRKDEGSERARQRENDSSVTDIQIHFGQRGTRMEMVD